MAGLPYVGPAAVEDTDLIARLQSTDLLSSGPVNRTGVSSQVHNYAAGGTLVSKSYIDTADAHFASVSYYQTRDALNILPAQKGIANGVATLDAAGTVPLAQIPVLGAGNVLGPFGLTSVTAGGSTSVTPLKLGEFVIGVQNVPFHPMVFASMFVTSLAGALPVIEARIGTTTPAIYGSTTLVGTGAGRTVFNSAISGSQGVTLLPAPDGVNKQGGNEYPMSYNIVISLWLYDLNNTTVTLQTLVGAAVYLLRTPRYATARASYRFTVGAATGKRNPLSTAVASSYRFTFGSATGIRPASYLDTFTRADSSTSAGPSWTNQVNKMGVLANQAYGAVGPANADAMNVASFTSVMLTNSFKVSAAFVGFSDTNANLLLIMAAGTTPSVKICFLNVYNSGGWKLTINTATSWDATTGKIAQTAPVTLTPVNGDVFSIERSGTVFTARQNGTSVATWNDAAVYMPQDANHRMIGMGIYIPNRARTTAARIDTFTAQDF